MNPISFEFSSELNESQWMGTIHEAGFGIPFQANFLNIPGASKTILYVGCDYNKLFQPVLYSEDRKFQRSVSHQIVTHITESNVTNAVGAIASNINNDTGELRVFDSIPPVFSISVSGAQAGPKDRGASHGWVDIAIIRNAIANEITSYENDKVKHYSFHFFNEKYYVTPDGFKDHVITREEAGTELCKFIEWFMKKVVLDKYHSWGHAINNLPISSFMHIDVIRAEDISIEEHLKLVKKDVPLVYHNGEFKRPVDYFREYDLIYRGSFNPITVAHEAIGEGALFEISLDNMRKGFVLASDVAGRINEISLTNNPVLITIGRPAFVELDELLVNQGGKAFKYIVGMDTFNDILNDKYNPTKNYLNRFYTDGSSFLVVCRGGSDIVENYRTALVNWQRYDVSYDNSISSTRVRNGELNLVSDKLRDAAKSRLGL